MAETQMSVKLLAHTQLTDEFLRELAVSNVLYANALSDTDGQTVALTAIRTCYSPLLPSEIAIVEGQKYFGKAASDGGTGTDADRLFRMIVKSGHTSTLEHLTFTFAVEGVSRSLLAQLTRHRVGFSFSVQSQRYVKLGSGDKSGGFDYVVPESIKDETKTHPNRHRVVWDETVDKLKTVDITAAEIFTEAMKYLQETYDRLRDCGIPAEDARAVLPNATATNLTMTANLRALLDFYSKRRKGRGAQSEIANLSERLRQCVTEVEPWVDPYFEQA